MDVTATEQIVNLDGGDNAPPNETPMPGVAKPTTALFPMCRPVSFIEQMRKWQPMGYRVMITLPYIGDDRTYLFMIRAQPHIPWLPDLMRDAPMWLYNTQSQIRYYNHFRPVIHDVSYIGAPATWGPQSMSPRPIPVDSNGVGLISITQHSPPPLFAELARNYRKWRGSIKYRLRCVSNFATQGYVFTTFLRRLAMHQGDFDFNKQMVPVYRPDWSYNQGMLNAYLASDCSMFRHIEVTAPYEYLTSWKDYHEDMFVRSAPKQLPNIANTARADHNLENFIGVGLRGQIAASDTQNQLWYELEYAAGDDFEFALPTPISQSSQYGVLASLTDTAADPVPMARRLITLQGYTIPNSTYSSDGWSFIELA